MTVEVKSPPITTAARGRCTSEPGPVAKRRGTRPRMATMAVMSTGLSLRSHPVKTASSFAIPSSLKRLM